MTKQNKQENQQQTNPYQPPKISFVRELCKGSTEEEIQEAEARLFRYLMLCKEIVEEELEREKTNCFDKGEDDL